MSDFGTEPHHRLTSSDGVSLAVYETPSREGTTVVFLGHATGFCAGVWRPVADGLSGAEGVARVAAWDFRGHGRSGVTSRPLSWWEMARDAAAVRDGTPAARAVGVGHSMGGAALVMAQLAGPSRFDALVLVEPIILPPPFVRDADAPLAVLTLKRRRRFADRAAAASSLGGKPPFRSWDGAAFAGYLDGGLVGAAAGVGLACDPRYEAEVYVAAPAHGAASRLGEVEVPVTVLMGADSDTYPTEWGEELASRFPRGRLLVVDGASHFLPMERPQVVTDVVAELALRPGAKPGWRQNAE